MSDAELTQRMLTLTPLGTSMPDVITTIQRKLRSNITRDEMRHHASGTTTAYPFKATPGPHDVVIRSILATYGWAKNLFCAGELVEGLWLFDGNGILVEVVVQHGSDGI